MILYHGTIVDSMLSIVKHSFTFDHVSKKWGYTYGKGIYFTSNYETARCYARLDGIVLSFKLEIKEYRLLKKLQSPSSKKKKYNTKWLITQDFDEYIMLR